MKKYIMCGLVICVTVVSSGVAETCVKSAFNVTYSCGDGTLVSGQTLPSAETVQYGSSFSLSAIGPSVCTPPSGRVYAGQGIYINGELVASYAGDGRSYSIRSFTYYYTSDITVAPYYATVADASQLSRHLYTGGRASTYVAAASGTWTVDFYYGAVSGVSKCSSVKPENTAIGYYTGLIPSDQDAIESSAAGSGGNCYCKMTQPYVAASPWVFYSNDGWSASYCASACARFCGNYVAYEYSDGRRFRASVWSAVGN